MSTGLRVFTLDTCGLVGIAQDEQTLVVRQDQITQLLTDLLRAASELAQNSSPGARRLPAPVGSDDTILSPLRDSVTGGGTSSNVYAFRCTPDESCGAA